ncbi:hypothetical protein ACJMK2_008820 [Sinanodonta woodiana]|uniref:Immunoglobulin subtype domain-containing protein n=1 Tax=Sinanodonta woodiana TaxID=1069815 RepID=A0ABD3VMQ7_SINWO
MAAFRELCLTSLIILFSRISGQWSGNATMKHCGSSDLTINFNFSLGGETFYRRSWFLNSTAKKIAEVDRTGLLTVEPTYIGRFTLSGMNRITLSHVNSSDSGSYSFNIVTNGSFAYLTATTIVIINGMYDFVIVIRKTLDFFYYSNRQCLNYLFFFFNVFILLC